jgi:predicted O-linked N-acetylglucosamine transferase (SPINDLY family)
MGLYRVFRLLAATAAVGGANEYGIVNGVFQHVFAASPLGIKLTAGTSTAGGLAVVKHVSALELQEKISAGDVVVSVNGADVTAIPAKQCVHQIKAAGFPVALKFRKTTSSHSDDNNDDDPYADLRHRTYRSEILLSQGDHAEGVNHLVLTLEIYPDHVNSWFRLSQAHADEGDHAQAIQALQVCAKLNPSDPQVWSNLGGLAYAHDELGTARAAFQALAELSSPAGAEGPSGGGPWSISGGGSGGQGSARRQQQQQAERAEAMLAKIERMEAAGEHVPAPLKPGGAGDEEGEGKRERGEERGAGDDVHDSDDGTDDTEAGEGAPLSAEQGTRFAEETLHKRREVLRGLQAKGRALQGQRMHAQARKVFRRSFDLAAAAGDSDTLLALHNAVRMLPKVYRSAAELRACRRRLEAAAGAAAAAAREWEAGQRAVGGAGGGGDGGDGLGSRLHSLDDPVEHSFDIVYMGGSDRHIMTSLRAAQAANYPALATEEHLQHVQHHAAAPSAAAPSAAAAAAAQPERRKLRVGFASQFFYKHSVCKLMCGVVRGLPRARFDVTVFVPDAGKNDGKAEDGFSALGYGLAPCAPAAGTSVESAAHTTVVRVGAGFSPANIRLAAAAAVDVMVYTGLGMDIGETTWAFARLAPVQVSFWGHPHTSGLPHVDYFVSSDLYEGALAQQRYSEQLVRFTSLGFYFVKPPPLPPAAHAALANDFLGLGPHAHVYLCAQSLFKFHPDFDQAVAQLLARDPLGVLLTLYNGNDGENLKILKRRLFRKAKVKRRQFVALPTMKFSDYQKLIGRSTVLLDPFPFGGGVTSLEAFAFCKPVLTLAGRQNVPELTAGRLVRAVRRPVRFVATSHEPWGALCVRIITIQRECGAHGARCRACQPILALQYIGMLCAHWGCIMAIYLTPWAQTPAPQHHRQAVIMFSLAHPSVSVHFHLTHTPCNTPTPQLLGITPPTTATMVAGMARLMGLERELVARNVSEYVDMAYALATDVGARAALERRICEQNAALFQSDASVREWASFLQAVAPHVDAGAGAVAGGG